ncbi:MAG: 50S ribosomal protein L31e [Nanoarchaeota archaeon]
MSEKMTEKTYIIPLGNVTKAPTSRRANAAVREVREYLKKHTKNEDIRIDVAVNEKLWENGISKPPRQIKLKVAEGEEGELIATLAE